MSHSIVDPETLGDYLCGVWKRNIEWRHFGPGFEFSKMTNSVVKIDKYKTSSHNSKDPNSIYLQWSFGESILPKSMTFGYVVKITNSTNSGNSGNMSSKSSSNYKQSGLLLLEWQFSGEQCSGWYHMKTHTLTLNFILKSTATTFTYRLIDENTMSLSCVEVDDDHTPTVQFGQMCRLNLKKYAKLLQQNGYKI